jgi:tRNA (cytidine56-2'-O)-methyltransferase|tara:strand:+ start:4393 stop:4899 length:507 start_codon:yes stop_codon:yes gene_type:complete
MVKVSVFRLEHRAVRDKRISTHVALVARAFGADSIYYSGDKDSEMEKSVTDIAESWGGPFTIEHVDSYRKFIKDFKGEKLHLTMYGLPYKTELKQLDKQDKLIIVGGGKVPFEVYEMADRNIAVTSQPHSEVAALGIFLEHLSGEKKGFKNAKQVITPQDCGKKVVEK